MSTNKTVLAELTAKLKELSKTASSLKTGVQARAFITKSVLDLSHIHVKLGSSDGAGGGGVTLPISISDVTDLQSEIDKLTKAIEDAIKNGQHNDLQGRDEADAHGMSSITGLDDAFQQLQEKLQEIEEDINRRVLAPVNQGTEGQLLAYKSEGETEWVTPADGITLPIEISNVRELQDYLDSKLEKPTVAGTEGQILSTNADGVVEWITTAEGITSHNALTGRESPECHSIEAITRLPEELEKRITEPETDAVGALYSDGEKNRTWKKVNTVPLSMKEYNNMVAYSTSWINPEHYVLSIERSLKYAIEDTTGELSSLDADASVAVTPMFIPIPQNSSSNTADDIVFLFSSTTSMFNVGDKVYFYGKDFKFVKFITLASENMFVDSDIKGIKLSNTDYSACYYMRVSSSSPNQVVGTYKQLGFAVGTTNDTLKKSIPENGEIEVTSELLSSYMLLLDSDITGLVLKQEYDEQSIESASFYNNGKLVYGFHPTVSIAPILSSSLYLKNTTPTAKNVQFIKPVVQAESVVDIEFLKKKDEDTSVQVPSKEGTYTHGRLIDKTGSIVDYSENERVGYVDTMFHVEPSTTYCINPSIPGDPQYTALAPLPQSILDTYCLGAEYDENGQFMKYLELQTITKEPRFYYFTTGENTRFVRFNMEEAQIDTFAFRTAENLFVDPIVNDSNRKMKTNLTTSTTANYFLSNIALLRLHSPNTGYNIDNMNNGYYNMWKEFRRRYNPGTIEQFGMFNLWTEAANLTSTYCYILGDANKYTPPATSILASPDVVPDSTEASANFVKEIAVPQLGYTTNGSGNYTSHVYDYKYQLEAPYSYYLIKIDGDYSGSNTNVLDGLFTFYLSKNDTDLSNTANLYKAGAASLGNGTPSDSRGVYKKFDDWQWTSTYETPPNTAGVYFFLSKVYLASQGTQRPLTVTLRQYRRPVSELTNLPTS